VTDSASAGTRDPSDSDDSDERSDYDVMLAHLDSAIDEARRKVESGRVYDADNESVRIKWIRALAYAVNVRRQVTTDRDLEDMTERLERLEDQREVTA